MLRLLLLCTTLLFQYLTGYCQSHLLEQKVSLQNREATIEEVLQEISEKHRITFSYSKDIIPVGQKVSIQVDSLPLSEVLQHVFTGKEIDFIQIGEQVVLKRKAIPVALQTIRGKITDIYTKEPLGFASIQKSRKSLGHH